MFDVHTKCLLIDFEQLWKLTKCSKTCCESYYWKQPNVLFPIMIFLFNTDHSERLLSLEIILNYIQIFTIAWYQTVQKHTKLGTYSFLSAGKWATLFEEFKHTRNFGTKQFRIAWYIEKPQKSKWNFLAKT